MEDAVVSMPAQLPLQQSPPPQQQQKRQQQPIMIASAMLYESALAKALAWRVVEACHTHDAWVIVGDDETGERDGGLSIFLNELERLDPSCSIRLVWSDGGNGNGDGHNNDDDNGKSSYLCNLLAFQVEDNTTCVF